MPELSQRILEIVPDAEDGWELYYRARQMQAAGQPVTMLSIGDHDIKTAPQILQAMQDSVEAGHLGYASVRGTGALRAAVADRITASRAMPAAPDQVLITTGGQGAIFAAMMAALDPGQECVILDPFYASFDVTVRSVSAHPVIVPTSAEEGFQPDPARIEQALTPRTRAILINTPNNPSGAVYARDRLEALAEICVRHDLWVISDEIYDSQVHDGDHVSPRDLPGMADRTFLVGSMSKGFAMTGARVGWVIAPVEATERMVDLAGATTYGLPGFIQDAAQFALTACADQEADVARRYRRRRDLALSVLGQSSVLRVVAPQGGMYIMLDVRGTGLSGDEFGARLLDEHLIGVMPGESFGKAAAGHVRIALTVADEDLEAALIQISRFAANFSID